MSSLKHMPPESILDLVRTKNHSMDTPRLVTYLNSYSYCLMRLRPELLHSFDEIHIDGIALVLFLRLFGIVRVERRSFDMGSYAPHFFEKLLRVQRTVYFIGGEPGEAERAVRKFQEAFPGLRVAGCRNGFFSNDAERRKTLENICAIAPDYVVCGMGTPLQEIFLLDLRRQGWQGTGFTCGGFLHQSAGELYYYPHWINRMNLRWLYRIYREPKLLYRYGWEYPKFVHWFLKDFVQWKRAQRRGM